MENNGQPGPVVSVQGTHRTRLLGIISLAFGILLAAYSTNSFTLTGSLLGEQEKKKANLADVSIKKEASAKVASNEDIVEHILIQNLGPQAVKKLRLIETKGTSMGLPLAQASIVGGAGTVTCKKGPKELSCSVAIPSGLPTGDMRTVELSFATHAPDQKPPCGQTFVSPPMQIELEGKPEDLNPANDKTEAVSTMVDCGDITGSVSLRASASPPPHYPNDLIKYTVDVTNYGPGKAAHVSFKHHFPSTLEFVNASIQNCTADTMTNDVHCALGDEPARVAGDLINGESAQVELTFRARDNTGCSAVETTTTLSVDPNQPDSTIDANPDDNASPLSIEVNCPEPRNTDEAPPQP